MNVLSLFDGSGACHVALERAGHEIHSYYSSEIEKHCVNLLSHKYPEATHLGDIKGWDVWDIDYSKIDLITAGFCCQSWSMAGKRLGIEDERGKLFNTTLKILEHVVSKNPNVKFLLENVRMKQEHHIYLNNRLRESLGEVFVREINSSLVSAQNRLRTYWTNFDYPLPQDRGICLNDVLENLSYPNKAAIKGRRLNADGKRVDDDVSIPNIQCLEVSDNNPTKSNCLTTLDKDNVLTFLPVGRHLDAFNNKQWYRYYTLSELCKLQTLPTDYFDSVSENAARKMLGNGWTVDVIAHIFGYLK